MTDLNDYAPDEQVYSFHVVQTKRGPYVPLELFLSHAERTDTALSEKKLKYVESGHAVEKFGEKQLHYVLSLLGVVILLGVMTLMPPVTLRAAMMWSYVLIAATITSVVLWVKMFNFSADPVCDSCRADIRRYYTMRRYEPMIHYYNKVDTGKYQFDLTSKVHPLRQMMQQFDSYAAVDAAEEYLSNLDDDYEDDD